MALNFTGGTGGVRICDGARNDVARFDATGRLVEYNDIGTVSRGVVAEYAEVSRPGLTASEEGTLYAVPAGRAGLYRASYYVRVTTAATTSASLTLTIGWSDHDDNTALTVTTPPAANTTDSGGLLIGSHLVDAAENSNVTYSTTYVSSGTTAMAYKLALRLEAL